MAVLEGARLLDPKAVGDLQLGYQKHHFESPGRELFVRFCVSISICEDSTHPKFLTWTLKSNILQGN